MDNNVEVSPLEAEKTGQDNLLLTEKEIELQNGEKIKLPTIHIGKMTLYHGSSISGITQFKKSEETTVGQGLYLTSQKEAAVGYAIVRSKNSEEQFIYEGEIINMNIANLSTRSAILEFAKYFRQEIISLKNRKSENWNYLQFGIFEKTLNEIDRLGSDKPVALKSLVWNYQDVTREILMKQGFDGLMTVEGGESGNGVTIGDHDSYVIFQPEKARITHEERVQKPIITFEQ